MNTWLLGFLFTAYFLNPFLVNLVNFRFVKWSPPPKEGSRLCITDLEGLNLRQMKLKCLMNETLSVILVQEATIDEEEFEGEEEEEFEK